VESHKTQVVAEAALGHGLVKVLREMQTYKKENILHQYVCFCSTTMLTSKIVTESVENHYQCCGCVNSCNKFFQLDLVNHEIPYDSAMKS